MSGSRGGLDRVLNHTVLQRGVLLLHSQGDASFSRSTESTAPIYFCVLCKQKA